MIPRRKAFEDMVPPYGRLGRLDDLLDCLLSLYIDSLGNCSLAPVTGHFPPLL